MGNHLALCPKELEEWALDELQGIASCFETDRCAECPVVDRCQKTTAACNGILQLLGYLKHKPNLNKIQEEQGEWAARNFPGHQPYQALLGAMEEMGELAHAHLKSEQEIRGSLHYHQAKAKDSIGDIIIFLLHYCNQMGWSMESIIAETWDVVKQRDWTKNKENGSARGG